MTTSPAAVKLQSFAISGAVATIAGSLYAAITRSFQADVFGPAESLPVLAMPVVGGIGSIGGAILGAVYLLGVPQIFGDTNTASLAPRRIGPLRILHFEHGRPIAMAGKGRARPLTNTR